MELVSVLEPYGYQRSISEWMGEKSAAALFAEQGLGKTKMVIDNFQTLYKHEKLSGVVVVTLAAVADNWVYNELPKHLGIQHQIIQWDSSSKKAKILFYHYCKSPAKDCLPILVLNKEALLKKEVMSALEQFMVRNDVMLIGDESTFFKNSRAKVTKAMLQLASMAKYRRALCGQPAPNGPDDLFSQYLFLDPNVLGVHTLTGFRQKYCNLNITWVNKRPIMKAKSMNPYGGFDEAVEPITARIFKKDVLKDLPEKQYFQRHYELTPKQRGQYEFLRKELILFLTESQTDGVVSAPNVISCMVRLQQFTSGFIVTEEGKLKDFKDTPKQDAAVQWVMEDPSPCIIWANFRHSIDILAERLEAAGRKVGKLYGGLTKAARQEVSESFRDGTIDVLLAHPRTGGWGLTFTNSSRNLYYENSFNWEYRVQSEDRTHRIGQTENVQYVDLINKNLIDAKIYERLQLKGQLNSSILIQDIERWL